MPTAELLFPSHQHEAENRGKLFLRSRRIQTRIKKNCFFQFHAARAIVPRIRAEPSFTRRQLAGTNANRIGKRFSRVISKLHGV